MSTGKTIVVGLSVTVLGGLVLRFINEPKIPTWLCGLVKGATRWLVDGSMVPGWLVIMIALFAVFGLVCLVELARQKMTDGDRPPKPGLNELEKDGLTWRCEWAPEQFGWEAVGIHAVCPQPNCECALRLIGENWDGWEFNQSIFLCESDECEEDPQLEAAPHGESGRVVARLPINPEQQIDRIRRAIAEKMKRQSGAKLMPLPSDQNAN